MSDIYFAMMKDVSKEHKWTPTEWAVGFLVFLVLKTKFPDKSSKKIYLKYLEYVNPLEKVDKLACGTGILYHWYRSLGECTRIECRQVSMCYTLLQVNSISKHYINFNMLMTMS